jgi:hypothetical protein
MRGGKCTSPAFFLLFFFLLCPGAEANKKIKLLDYMFPAETGSYYHYKYIKYPAGQLNFPGTPDFTVSVTKGDYGSYTGIYQIGDYYFPDYYSGTKTLYINADKKNPGLVGTDEGWISTPIFLPVSVELDTIIEHPGGDTNCPWYFKEVGTVTVPAGTFKKVVVKLDLDRRFSGAPNAGNYLFGTNVPEAGVTHATWYVKGFGEIMNMDFDENGDILFLYVLESANAIRRK